MDDILRKDDIFRKIDETFTAPFGASENMIKDSRGYVIAKIESSLLNKQEREQMARRIAKQLNAEHELFDFKFGY